MAKKFTFDDAITTDIKGAASNSYIDNIKMIKIADIETNAENFYSLPDIEDLAEDIDRQGLIHSLAVAKISSEKYKLISGHRRLTAIKLLIENGKWNNETVPCYVITAKKSDAEMNLDLIMLNHTQRKYSDADIFKEHEELKKIFTQLEADGVEIKGRLREKIAKAMHVSSAQIGKIENIKNNAIDSVKVAVENGELSISTANEIAKHNATKQQEIISSPIEKIKTADVRNTNKDKSKAKTPKCDEPNNYSTSDEATEIYLTTDETMFMKKNLDILGFSYLLSVSSDSDKRIIENGGIKVIETEKGMYVAMPNHLGKDKQYYDDCYPVTAEMRKAINKAVMTAYENNATAVIKSEPEAIATKVKVIPNNNPDSNLKGFAQITMDDCFVVSGVKVFDGENGMFLQMPQYKNSAGEYKNVANPVTKDFHNELSNKVIAAYKNVATSANKQQETQTTATSVKR